MPNTLAVNLSLVGTKPTGIATYALNLIPELHLPDLTLLCPQRRIDRFPISAICSATYYQVPANLTPEQGKLGHLRRLLWTQFQVPKICKELRSSLFFSPVPEAPLGTGNRSVVMVHDLIPLRFPRATSPLTQYFRHYVPYVLKQAEHIICNSVATAKDITDFWGIPAAKITPILLSHDVQHFRIPESEITPPERPYFFYVGRHDPYKNLQRVISAFAALPHFHNYELWIAGSTDPRFTPLLHSQVEQLGIQNQVKFLDYVSYAELPRLLHESIALVYPSLWEGFGFPVLEAMACGTAVITSNLSSLPEVAGDAAILVDPYNETEITDAMKFVATDGEGRSQLEAAGLARANQFSWAKTGQATSEVLKRYF